MTRLFLDTGVFVALVSTRDPHRENVLKVLDQIKQGAYSGVYTSDFVLAETWNFIRQKIRRKEAATAIVRLAFGTTKAPPLVSQVLRVNSARFAAALDRYQSGFSRGLSFTDWTNVVVMEDERIDTIATLDGGFKGLVDNVVPRPGS